MTGRRRNPPLKDEKAVLSKKQLEHYHKLAQSMESGHASPKKDAEFAAELTAAAPMPRAASPRTKESGSMDWHVAQGSAKQPYAPASRRDTSPVVVKADSGTRSESSDVPVVPIEITLGWFALVLSLVSLFLLPGILGSASIILGLFAVLKGNRVGVWPVLIGFISVAASMMLLPFFS